MGRDRLVILGAALFLLNHQQVVHLTNVEASLIIKICPSNTSSHRLVATVRSEERVPG